MLLLLIVAFFSLRYYAQSKAAFFDDTFIYLHIARNAIESGTFQYFPLVNRGALLASSPLKLCILTIAAWLSNLLGYTERSIEAARVSLSLYGVLLYILFSFFWLKNIRYYLWVGVFYFFLAGCLDTVFEFEGGLLLLWSLTMVMQLRQEKIPNWQLALTFPLGLLIRPDLSMLIYPVLLGMIIRRGLLQKRHLYLIISGGVIVICIWVVIAMLMGVYPIPVTYWAKAAIPKLFDKQSLLEVLFVRLGRIFVSPNLGLSDSNLALVGYVTIAMVFWLVLLIDDNKCAKIGFLPEVVIVTLIAGTMFSRMPANYWWYYQNIAVLICIILLATIFEGKYLLKRLVASVSLTVLVILLSTKFIVNPQLPWDFARDTRAQGYKFIGEHATGRGTYILPIIGEVIIKNPEIGMISYFSGRGAWIWDSAGLAQPAIELGALNSKIKYFYPKRLWESPNVEVHRIEGKSSFPIYEVWALDDRDYDAARKKCQIVIEGAAIGANLYKTNTN